MNPEKWPAKLIGPHTDGYLNWPVPDALDEQIGAALAAAQLDGPERDGLGQLRSEVNPEAAEVLGCFAQRAAVIAVRRGEPGWLELAVMALGLASGHADYRDVTVVLTLIDDAARRLKVGIGEVLAAQGWLLEEERGQRFAAYLHRDTQATPEEMGWRAEGLGAEFRFVRHAMY